ncbi:leucyl aminopeptidase [Mycena filopes]|nr:leucyl aminopeptidase [Mycena filopes]
MATFTGDSDSDGEDSQYRLPTNTRPTHYNLTILTDLKALTFAGTVEIDLTVNTPTTSVVLNVGTDLALQDISFSTEDGQTFIPISEATDNLSERVTLVFPSAIGAPGSTARLFIAFTGALTGSMVGYYRSLTTGPDEDKKYCALTQFEPTAARRAFPCYDEPALKATFAINLVGRSDTVNLSNMPAYSEEPCDPSQEFDRLFQFQFPEDAEDDDDAEFAWKITRFEPTPAMSTYLVAFANGDFQYLESAFCSPLSGRTVPLRIYTDPKNLSHARFVLELTARVLPLYEQVFDIEYPLPKVDTLVGTEYYFKPVAMENWGLIIGRTSGYLLTDPSMLRLRKEIVALQTHEIAHMWFGNITTMRCLTPSIAFIGFCFATLIGEAIISGTERRIYPEWKLDAEFINEHLNKAFSLDSGLSSHPVEVVCPDANKINQVFDGLAYSKAASVLRMLSRFVGEDKFLKGVSLYLKEKLYGNSTTTDLWNGVEKATGLKVAELMEAWISKAGFPVVTVEESPDGVKLRQDRFIFTGPEGEDSTTWNIPLQILSVDVQGRVSVDRQAVLRDREQFIKLDTSRPFKLNADTTGYYRAIGAEAAKENSAFSLQDRVGLVNDAVALAKADLSTLGDALSLIYALREGNEYHVWAAIASNLASLSSIWWEDERITDLLNAFRRTLFSPLIARLGYDSIAEESSNESLLRTCAVTQALDVGDTDVANELKARFTHFLSTGDEANLPADLVTAIHTAAVKYGGRQEYDAMKALCERQALCAAGNPEFVNETLDFVLSGVRDQDVRYFVDGLARNVKTRRRAALFFLDHFEEIHERFKDGFGMADLLQDAFSSLSSESDHDWLATFFKNKDTSKFDLPLSQILDSIKGNSACIARSTEDLRTWLEEWNGNGVAALEDAGI